MPDLNLSISDLFERAFGVSRGSRYDAKKINDEAGKNAEFEVEKNETSEGTEFVDLRKEIGAKLPDGRPIFMPVQIGDLTFPNEPTIAFSRRKIIAKTGLVGSTRNGSVKELIRANDWQLIIRGIAVNEQSTQFYPEDQIKDLNDLANRNEALEITSALTSLLGIYNIVIESFRLTEMVGIQHAQAYEFRCISDEDFILNLD